MLKIILALLCAAAYVALNYRSLLVTIKHHSRQTKAEDDLGLFLAVFAALAGGAALYWSGIWLGIVMIGAVLVLWYRKYAELDRLAEDEERDIRAGLRAFNMFNFNEKLFKRCIFWLLRDYLVVTTILIISAYLLIYK